MLWKKSSPTSPTPVELTPVPGIPSGEVWRTYYFAGAQRVAVRIQTSETGNLRYLLSDHLGSTSLTVNYLGSKLAENRYDAFPPSGTLRGGNTRYQQGTMATDYQYTGQRFESGIGLYYYNARWYDPYLNRFAQPDTIVPPGVQGYDRYAYTNNNPVNATDPSGHYPASACNDLPQDQKAACLAGADKEDGDSDPPENPDPPIVENNGSGGDDDGCNDATLPAPFRAATAIFLLPYFIIVDLALVGTTLVISAALGSDPEPFSKLLLVGAEIIISAGDVIAAYAEINYVHWVYTGSTIKSLDDATTWPICQ